MQCGVNVDQSIRKGQPVLVYGRYYMREYKVEEQLRNAYELEAVAVGHDLARGTSQFTRVYQSGPSVTLTPDENGLPADESDHWLDLSGPANTEESEPEPEFAPVP